MTNYDLSVLIPARNEMFLAKTVESVLKAIRGNTEIIVIFDGNFADPGIPEDPRVTVTYNSTPKGQRGATNQAARISKAKWLMKLDAHCDLDEGFDVKMLAVITEDMTLVPMMRNLHSFDWLCIGKHESSVKRQYVVSGEDPIPPGCGHRSYQGPTPEKCEKCGGNMVRELLWKAKESPRSTSFRFDKTLHFQYFNEYKNRPEGKGDLTPTLSIQGSCFMLSREKYWELNICDEEFGSWGQQGVEVACKTWLSGGRVMCLQTTWYAHMFRTQGSDFSFPYPQSGKQIDHARKYSRELFLENKWPQAIHDLDWLLQKFYPVPDWHDVKEEKPTKLTKEVIYYTDGEVDGRIGIKVRTQLLKGMKGKHIIGVSLEKNPELIWEYDDFKETILLNQKRGYLTMARQILMGLEKSTADVIYFAEHDVMYHPSHFAFVPPDKDKYYYNTNVWRIRSEDGHALYTDNLQQLSGLVAYRETLLEHYRKRVKMLENIQKYAENEHSINSAVRAMGFEPGTHNREERVDDLKAESFLSEFPNLDIRHSSNLTPSRWRKDQFRNERYTQGWKEAQLIDLPGWTFETNKAFDFTA